MPLPPYILADADDVLVKVVIGIIVLVVWGIGALANLAKKQQHQQEQRSREEMERAMRLQMDAARRNQAAAEALGQGPVSAHRPPPPPPLPPMAGFVGGYQQQQPQRPRSGPVVPPMRSQPRPQQRPGAGRSVPPPPLQQRQQQQPPRPRGPVMRPKQTKQAQRRQQQQQRPAPQPVLEEIGTYSEGPNHPGVTESEIGAGTVAASPTRRLATVGPMVRLTRQSLREQFILTEILQPPLALREPRET